MDGCPMPEVPENGEIDVMSSMVWIYIYTFVFVQLFTQDEKLSLVFYNLTNLYWSCDKVCG